MIWADNAAGHPRIGLIVPRFQSSAVARNRLRRRLREIWRREHQSRQPAWDVIIRARPAAYRAQVGQLRHELESWNRVALPGG